MKLRAKLVVLLPAIAALVAAGLVANAQPAAAVTQVGPVQVANYNSGLCLDVSGGATSDGTAIQQWTCNRTPAQQWYFTYQQTDGHFLMIPGNTVGTGNTGCLTIPNWSTAVGEDAKLYSCVFNFAASNQGFTLVQDTSVTSPLPTPGAQFRYRFINWFSGMCLEVDGGSTSRGARVQQAPCNGSFQQYWIVTT